jgi:hypothetical protein
MFGRPTVGEIWGCETCAQLGVAGDCDFFLSGSTGGWILRFSSRETQLRGFRALPKRFRFASGTLPVFCFAEARGVNHGDFGEHGN